MNPNQPHVSVIIPTYNRKIELSECLEALARQTYKNFEVIIVNDHGDPVENTVALFPELTTKVVNQESNQKHVHARNRGLQYAQGEYILLCDDDDLLLPTHLELMLAHSHEADLLHSDVEIFEYTKIDDRRIPTNRFLFAYTDDLEGMRTFSTFVSSGCLYRKSIHDSIGPFDTEVYNYWDWDFYLTVRNQFRTKRIPTASVLYAYSRTGGQESSEMSTARKQNLDRLAAKHQLGDLPTKNFFMLLEEPQIKAREAKSQILWDGSPMVSRIARN